MVVGLGVVLGEGSITLWLYYYY